MLKKATRKMFLDHNWEYIQKHDSNPSQKWTRIRDRANTLLHDLALLAEKLPDEKLPGNIH